MMYKIRLDDNSFIIVDREYVLRVFPRNLFIKGRNISVEKLVGQEHKYYLKDLINHKLYKRSFVIEETEENYPKNIRLKMSQDIRKGDFLIDEKGQPTRVEILHSGEDEMYEIEIDGVKTIVNGGHFLHLIDEETDEELDVPINIYIHFPDEVKNKYKMKKKEEIWPM